MGAFLDETLFFGMKSLETLVAFLFEQVFDILGTDNVGKKCLGGNYFL